MKSDDKLEKEDLAKHSESPYGLGYNLPYSSFAYAPVPSMLANIVALPTHCAMEDGCPRGGLRNTLATQPKSKFHRRAANAPTLSIQCHAGLPILCYLGRCPGTYVPSSILRDKLSNSADRDSGWLGMKIRVMCFSTKQSCFAAETVYISWPRSLTNTSSKDERDSNEECGCSCESDTTSRMNSEICM